MFRKILSTTAAISFLASVATATQAQDMPSLPGGATSVSESHGDWTVGCGLQTDADTTIKVCNLVQEQLDSRTRQRVLAVEVRPGKDTAKVVFILPFGLDLQKGLTVQVDDHTPSGTRQFRTCLPAGCVLEMKIDADLLTELGKGNQLKLHVMADGGKDAGLAISLKGFQAAYNRTLELEK